MYSSSTPRRTRATFSLCVDTTMPFATGSVQAAKRPRRPRTSTKQTRQEPKAFKLSVAQSLGMFNPAVPAARRMDVPAGADTGCPSMVSATSSKARPLRATGGVP